MSSPSKNRRKSPDRLGPDPAPPPAAVERRAVRLALSATLRDFRRSIARGRPISLGNLLRLYRRRVARDTAPVPVDGLATLQRAYRNRRRPGARAAPPDAR